jgi:hypothetical protein
VNVAPGDTAHTLLAYHDVAVHTESGCDPVYSAVELRVYPPGQRSPTDSAFTFEVAKLVRRGCPPRLALQIVR